VRDGVYASPLARQLIGHLQVIFNLKQLGGYYATKIVLAAAVVARAVRSVTP
jgi:hypothetical protein